MAGLDMVKTVWSNETTLIQIHSEARFVNCVELLGGVDVVNQNHTKCEEVKNGLKLK
jgi:hypothetical protein